MSILTQKSLMMIVVKPFELPGQKRNLLAVNVRFKKSLKKIPRVGELIGFCFKHIVPASVYIDFGSVGKVEIKTLGKNPFILDSPIMLRSIAFVDFGIGFSTSLECLALYGTYKNIRLDYCGISFYDGFQLMYIGGMMSMRTALRPLKNIIQDLVQEGPPMLMRRSTRDYKIHMYPHTLRISNQ